MSKDNQIEEMAKATMKHCEIDNQCGTCYWSTCNECLAEILYNAGYRKQKEVAREIFEEIERFLYLHFRFCKEEIGNDDTECVKGRMELNTQIQNFIAELKKKYTEDKR